MKSSRVFTAGAGALMALTLALSGCSTPKETPGDDNSTTLSSSSRSAIDQAVSAAMALSHSSQAIVGVWDADGEYVRGYTTGSASEVDANTLFRAAQTSQPVLCALLLDLVDDGVLKLDREVSQDLTRQSGIGNITYRQLCNGTSGLADFKPRFASIIIDNPSRNWPAGELLAESFIQGPLSWPGLDVHRSDTNAVLLAKALRVVANEPIEQLLAERVFEPAGMLSSVFPSTTADATTKLEGAITATTFPSGPMCEAGVQTLTEVSPSILGAAGATITTVGDLKRFYEHYLGGTFGGSASSIITETLPLANPKRDEDGNALPVENDEEQVAGPEYGFGLINEGPLWGYDGMLPGTISASWHNPETGFTVVVALNNSSAGASFATHLAHQIAALLGNAGDAWSAEDQAALLAAAAVCQEVPEDEQSDEAPETPAAE